jgi:hypothetical protein
MAALPPNKILRQAREGAAMHHLNKGLALMLLLTVLFLPASPAKAEASSPTGLTLQELTEWADRMLVRARASQPIGGGSPSGELTEDGYEVVYDFATLYLDTPQLTDASVLNAIVVTNEDTPCPRDIPPYATDQMLLSAYANENPELIGSEDFAALYLWEDLPKSADWGWIQRDGQTLTQVQYAVQEQQADGSYTDCGLSYILSGGYITAIRAYGLSASIPADDLEENLQSVREVKAADSYFAYPQSSVGTDLEPFDREDLLFSGMDFLSLSPESAIAVLGGYEAETWLEDDDGEWLRILQWPQAEITFLYTADKVFEHVDNLALSQRGLEGPRAVMVGDSMSSVLNRFRHGEGELLDGREVLYVDGETPPFGVAEYEDATATLHYSFPVEGVKGIGTVTLQMIFVDTSLSELFLYSW